MEKIINSIFERISAFFENLKPPIKTALLAFFSLLYGCSYWLAKHAEFKSLRHISLYLIITIIVLLFFDLNNHWKQKEIENKKFLEQEMAKTIAQHKQKLEINKVKQQLKTLLESQLRILNRAISSNDQVITTDGLNKYEFDILVAKGFLKKIDSYIYKIPDNIFGKLKSIDLYSYIEKL